jgi:hypothetical protein
MTRRELTMSLAALFGWPRLALSQQEKQDVPRISGVSMIRVIANPSDFDGRQMRLMGYLTGNGVDLSVGLYVSEVDGRNFNILNSIDVRVEHAEVRNLFGKYVQLTGTFHAPYRTTEYNGYLDHISRLKAWTFGDLARYKSHPT